MRDVIFHYPKINSFLLLLLLFSTKSNFTPNFIFVTAAGINVPLPRALDGVLNAIVPSELLFLDVEAIVAEIVSYNTSMNVKY